MMSPLPFSWKQTFVLRNNKTIFVQPHRAHMYWEEDSFRCCSVSSCDFPKWLSPPLPSHTESLTVPPPMFYFAWTDSGLRSCSFVYFFLSPFSAPPSVPVPFTSPPTALPPSPDRLFFQLRLLSLLPLFLFLLQLFLLLLQVLHFLLLQLSLFLIQLFLSFLIVFLWPSSVLFLYPMAPL